MIKDSGNRAQFETGAVRDMGEGKGRCDLMPLDIVATALGSEVIDGIENFRNEGEIKCLFYCIEDFFDIHEVWKTKSEMFLDVAKHFENGAKKYGENNWQKGIPLHSYIDSAIRHFLKWRSGYTDEPHDRAFVWNIMCAIWTYHHKPELDDFTIKKASCVQKECVECRSSHGDGVCEKYAHKVDEIRRLHESEE